MRFASQFFCSLAIVFGLLAAPAVAQSSDTAGLEVDIHDTSGALVTGAKLSLINHATHISRTGVSNVEGRYRFADVPIGDYTLTITKQGFNDLVESGISLSVAQSASLPLTLQVSGSQQSVEVTGEVPIVDLNRTTTGQTISTQEIENLPSNGRNFTDFALTVPGITPQATSGQGSGLSVNGQRSRSNNIMIDGVENNGQLNGTVRQTLSQDAIAQFQVMTNQFLPEYGNAGGGLINVVTKTGTNNLHGDLFYFERNQALNATPYFVAKPIFVQNDFGATLGGPIRRDKTFFFASGEYLGLNTNVSNNLSYANDIDTILRLRPIVGGDVTSVNGSPTTNQATAQTIASLRVDHTIDPANTLTFRFLYGHYIHANPTLDASSVNSDISNYGFDRLQDFSYLGEYTHIFTSNLLNEFHFQYSPQFLIQVPNDPIGPAISITGVAVLGRNINFPTLLDESHYEVIDALSWSRGNHLLKFGADENLIRAHTSFPTDFAGIFSFDCLYAPAGTTLPARFPGPAAGATTCGNNFEQGKPAQFTQGFGTPDIRLPDWLIAFYAEDSWKLTPRVTVNYGIRYDLDLQPQGYNNDLTNPIQAPLPKGIPRDVNNFSPRVAVAWGLDKSGKTVLRAGFGVFYDKIFLLVARNTLLARSTLTLSAAASPTQFLTGPYPQSTNYPTGTNVAQPTTNAIPPTLPIPSAEQADLYVDQALSKDWSLEVGYVYVDGLHQLKASNVNLGPPTILTAANTSICSCTPNFQQLGRPYYGNADRLNHAFNNIQEVGSWGHSRYDAMQASVVRRTSNNLTLRASWTWSKELDDASDFTQAQQPDNPYNPHAERSLGNEDQRNRFAGSAVYSFPYLLHSGSHHSVARWVFGDWVGSSIVSAFSGTPRTITVGRDVNLDGNSSPDRPYIDGLNGTNGGYIVKRNDFRGPRQQNVSIRLQKRLNFGEQRQLEFSAEAFNTFNHANFSGVYSIWGTGQLPTGQLAANPPIIWGVPAGHTAAGTVETTSTFGAFTTANDPREVQLGIKLFF